MTPTLEAKGRLRKRPDKVVERSSSAGPKTVSTVQWLRPMPQRRPDALVRLIMRIYVCRKRPIYHRSRIHLLPYHVTHLHTRQGTVVQVRRTASGSKHF